jgi:hypothetical protein
MSLASGERVIRYRLTELPVPQEAINRVLSIGQRQGMPSLITYVNRHGREIGDTVADCPEDNQEDDDDETYENSNQSDKELDKYDESSTDDSSSSSDTSDDDDDDYDDGASRSVGTRQETYDIMPIPQPEVDPDGPNPAPAMIDPNPPANQLNDDGSVDGSEPDENPGVEGMNLGPDEMGLDENGKDPTNPGVEPDVEEEVDCLMDEHERFRAAEAEGRARALADNDARLQHTV